MISVLEQNWWAFAVRGIIAILFGTAAFALPGSSILSLVFLFAGYAGTGGMLNATGQMVECGGNRGLFSMVGRVNR